MKYAVLFLLTGVCVAAKTDDIEYQKAQTKAYLHQWIQQSTDYRNCLCTTLDERMIEYLRLMEAMSACIEKVTDTEELDQCGRQYAAKMFELRGAFAKKEAECYVNSFPEQKK